MSLFRKIAAAAVFVNLAAAAQAGSIAVVKTEVVSFADLNLENPAGMAALDARLRAAASVVCGGKPDFSDMHRLDAYETCTEKALAGARGSLDARLAAVGKPRVAQVP